MEKTFKLICAILLSGTLVIPATMPAFAEGVGLTNRVSSSSARGDLKPTIQAKISGTLQERAEQEISRRITSLQNVQSRINDLKKLSADQKSALTTQVQQEIDTLTALQTKIKGDTDLQTLKTDVQSIVKDYRVYLLFIPKIYILASANRIDNTADQMSSVAAKLQTRISEAQANGQDTASLQSLLTDMKSKIADAQTQAQNAMSTVIPLTPEGYPGNKTSLESARKMIQTGHQDLMSAYHDAQEIVQGLRSIKIENKNASSSGRANDEHLLHPSSSSAQEK